MYRGAELKTITVSQQSRKPFKMTAFIFTFKLENSLPPLAQIQIKYPDQITADQSYFAVTVSNFGAYPSCTLDTVKQTILCKNVTYSSIAAGTTYIVTVHGLINSKKAAVTDSFELYTLTQNGEVINYADKGLRVSSECDYPCYTCSASQPNRCLSCEMESTFNLFYNNQCLEKCPSTYYAGNHQCLKCDSNCAECANGPQECTKCSSGKFLEGTACVSQCTSDYFIPDSKNNLCNPCSYPCSSCTGNVNTCTSCLQNVDARFLYQNSCYAECPLGTIASGTNCVPCNSNCRSCVTNQNTCDSCYSPLKLNKMNMTCVLNCPLGLTIDTGSTCEYCDLNCKTCDLLNPKKCLSCYQGLSLYEKNSTCLTSCPSGTTQVVNTTTSTSICQECTAGCTECQYQSDYCTRCDDTKGYLFYNFTCIKDNCPTGYIRLSPERNICVRDGERCPFGYDFNDFGVCELIAQVCEEGYILNHDKTRCIPVPGFYIPFIFIIVSIVWTLFIVLKYRKQFPPIDIITQLLVFYTAMQTVSYIVMVALAITLDYILVKSIHLIAIVSMFFANVAFTLLFHLKLRREDKAFKHWYTEFKKTYTTIKFLTFFLNFKFSRCLYSKLFPPSLQFNASFDNKYRNIVKPLFITTVVNFMVQVIPVLVMDIYNLIFIPWGYQIMVMSIDNFVMGLAIFILEVIEFRHYKKQAIDTKELMQQKDLHLLYKNVHDHNVMSGFDDNSLVALKLGISDFKEAVSMLSIDNDLQLNDKSLIKNKVKKEEESEKQLLERLVKQLAHQRKFNEIYEDSGEQHSDDEDDQSVELFSDDADIEKMKPRKRSFNDDSCTNKPTKVTIDDTRERIDNKLSFKQTPGFQKQTVLQKRIQHFLSTPIFQEADKIENYDIQDQKDVFSEDKNMESARTEKYQYQQPSKDSKSPNEVQSQSKLDGDTPNDTFDKIQIKDFDEPEKNKEDFETLKIEFQDKLKRKVEGEELYVRDWHSCDDNIMRDQWDDVGPESDFDLDDNSHESFPNNPDRLKNADFLAKLELFRERMKSKYQFNNCYTHTDNPYNKSSYNLQKTKNVTRRTQTYEKDIGIGYDPFAKDDTYAYLNDERHIAELETDYARQLIARVIDQISDPDSYIERLKDDGQSDDTDFDFERVKKSKKRKRDIQFDIDDIMGMFDIDDYGNIVLNKETMRDNLNRRVNKHGYLVDHQKNIINQDGDIIFEADELDEDEEIPLPYRFEKRKKQLLKQEEKFNEVHSENNYDLDDILQDEDAKIEEEFQKLKDVSRPSSVDSLMGDLPGTQPLNNQQDDQTMGDLDQFEYKQGKEDSASKREKDLAKAYGGKVKPKKKKKTKKKKADIDGSGDRLPTDRMFPYLQQEEERVKRMAMISYQIESNNRNIQVNQQSEQLSPETKQKDFESYFKEQLQEIQQFRQNVREELIQNQPILQTNIEQDQLLDSQPQQLQHIEFYQQQPNDIQSQDEQQENLKRMDSAATDKLFQQQPEQQDEIDPLQQLIEQDAERVNKFFERVQRNTNNQSALNTYTQQIPVVVQTTIINNRLHSAVPMNVNFDDYNMQQNVKSMGTINLPQPEQYGQSSSMQQQTLSKGDASTLIQSNMRQPSWKFDFYLPNQSKKKKNIQKDKEKKDISFSNIGRMQLQGTGGANGNDTGRIKDLERVYLQKYPMPPKTSMGESRPIQASLPMNKRRMMGGPFRSNTLSDAQQFRPSQTTYSNQGFIPQYQNYQATSDALSGSGLGVISNTVIGSGLNQDLLEFGEHNIQTNDNDRQNDGDYEQNNLWQ